MPPCPSVRLSTERILPPATHAGCEEVVEENEPEYGVEQLAAKDLKSAQAQPIEHCRGIIKV
jgi:hypothetical protein